MGKIRFISTLVHIIPLPHILVAHVLGHTISLHKLLMDTNIKNKTSDAALQPKLSLKIYMDNLNNSMT